MGNINGVRLVVVPLFMALAACGAALAACGTSKGWVYTCDHPDHPVPGDIGPDGQPDPCHRQDAGVDSDADIDAGTDDSLDPHAESQCDGECAPGVNRVDWVEEPMLLWVGDPDQAPVNCPDNAPIRRELHKDPISSTDCHACICGDPACVLPEGLIASDSVGCMGPTLTPFPITPDGACSTPPPVEYSDLQSLALLPPTVSSCTPSLDMQPPKGGQTLWSKTGVVCAGEAYGMCDDTSKKCTPATSADFMQCVMARTVGDEQTPCPDDYTLRVTLYDEVDEKVTCTPCTCGSPLGSNCIAAISAYQDKTCTPASAIFKDYLVPQGGPQCASVGANTALQSAASKWITSQPGACMPDGGKPTGKVAVEHATARTFCCRKGEEHDVPK